MGDCCYKATVFGAGEVFTALADTAREAAVQAWRESLRAVVVEDVDHLDGSGLLWAHDRSGPPSVFPMTDHLQEQVLLVGSNHWPIGFVKPLHRESDR